MRLIRVGVNCDFVKKSVIFVNDIRMVSRL